MSLNCSIDTKRLTLEGWKDLHPRVSASAARIFDGGRNRVVGFFKCVYGGYFSSCSLLTAISCSLCDQHCDLHLSERPLLIEQ